MTNLPENPLVTFALFAYNQERFIREAVEGAFWQTYSPLEIILSDDCSTDSTFYIMEKMKKKYSGQNIIVLNRTNFNKGIVGHFNEVFLLARGDIIVVAAGDDVSLPDRVEKTCDIFIKNTDVFSVSMETIPMDAKGRHILSSYGKGKEGEFCLNDYFSIGKLPKNGASRAYKKVVFDSFGPLDPEVEVEDTPMVFRALLLGKVFHSKEFGIFYRLISGSLSSGHGFRRRMNVYRQNVNDIYQCWIDGAIDSNKKETAFSVVLARAEKKLLEWKLIRSGSKIKYLIKEVVFSSVLNKNKKYFYVKTFLLHNSPLAIIKSLRLVKRAFLGCSLKKV
jgi:glycosyltransferase involved in cell wall biosynthesis